MRLCGIICQQFFAPGRLAARKGTEQIVPRRAGLWLSLSLLTIYAPCRLLAQDAAFLRAAVTAPSATTALNVAWSPVALQTYSTLATGPAGGRILSVALDPADSTGNTVYLGTNGGVWKSTNAAGAAGAVTFTPLTDQVSPLNAYNTPISVVSAGAVSVQPGGTGVVLAGTGDPTNRPDAIYGTGILRSADAGRSWSVIQSTQSVNGQATISFFGEAFTGFAWSTTSRDLVVAAVASAGGAAAVNAGYATQSAMGLYYSQDAGRTWLLATITDGFGKEIQGQDIGVGSGAPTLSVVWNPVRRLFLAALRSHGFYQSSDGITWTRLTIQPGTTLTTQNCPAGQGGGGGSNCLIYQAALAVQPGTGDTFAMFTSSTDGDGGLWQDICAAVSGNCTTASPVFAHRILNTAFETSPGVISGASHAMSLQAAGVGTDTVLLAGTQDLFRCSLTAGCVWRNTTNVNGCQSAHVGASQHQVIWLPGSSTFYFATDRGLWRTTDAVNQQQPACSADDAAHFDNLNASLGAVAEITWVAQDSADASTLMAGEGDLGTAGGSNDVWQALLTGQGSQAAIGTGASAGSWFATSGAGVSISACSLGSGCGPGSFGTQPVVGNTQVSGDGTQLKRPAVWALDPQDPQRIIVGTCRVWRGLANGTGWAPSDALSTMLDNQPAAMCQSGNTQLRSLAATGTLNGSSTLSERIYAGLAGLPDGAQAAPGHIYSALVTPSSTAASTVWRDLTTNPLTNATASTLTFNPGYIAIASIAIDPTDSTGATLYLGLNAFGGGGFSESANVSQVYGSTDAGSHWVNLTSNLPNVPVNAVLVDPQNPAIVYLATDVGVYVTTTITQCGDHTQSCWGLYGTGLPPVRVTSLAVSTSSSSAWLRIGTWGRGVWQTELAGAVLQQQAALAASVTPATLSFAGQPVGSVSNSQTLTIQNTGQGAVALGAPIVSTADFTVTNNCGASLATGASCTLAVSFAPTGTGSRSATVTMTTNTRAGDLAASLSGTGLPGGVIVLTPLRVDFGALLDSQTSPAQFVTLANTGTAPAALQPFTISGPFRITANSCGASLAPNTSCTLGIVFMPTSPGPATGNLVVTDDGGTQTAILTGTGQAAASDTLSVTVLTFAPQQLGTTSAQQQVLLTNGGDAALNGIGIRISGDFTVVNQCGASLPGHSSCAMLVAYAPQTLGAESGQLIVQDLMQQQTVSLSGSGVPPPLAPPGSGGGAGLATVAPLKIDFGVEGVAALSSAQTITLINSGATVLSSIAVSASQGFNIVANACTSPLNPGASCTAQVVFAPQAPGTQTGLVEVTAATLAAPVMIPLTGSAADFQLAVQGASSSTVVGGAPATYQLILTPVGASAGPVALTCTGMPPGSTCAANPGTVTMTGDGATATIVVTVATASTVADTHSPTLPWLQRGWPGLAMASLLPLVWGGRRGGRRLRQHCAMTAVGLLCLGTVGCGLAIHGGGSTATQPGTTGSAAQGTYTITVGASAPGLVRTVSLNLVVE